MPPFSSRSEVILLCPVSSSEKLQNSRHKNASLQELIDSLGNSNSSIGNALTTASNTRSSLETLTAQNRQSLQNYRSSLNQSLLPQLNQSLDGLATLSGSLSSTLTGVNPTITQLKVILTQLKSSLNEVQTHLVRPEELLKA